MKLPRVLVLGPMSAQGRQLQQRLEGVARVTVVDSGRLQPAITPGYDLYVNWIRFSNHTIRRVARKIASGRWLEQGGGLDSLADRIRQYFAAP